MISPAPSLFPQKHAFGVDDEWLSDLGTVPSSVPGVGPFRQALLGQFPIAPKPIPIFERPAPRRAAWAGLALLAIVITAIGMTRCAATAHAPLDTTAITHELSEPYTAWAFCPDTSLSLLPEEFERLKLICQDTVRSRVEPNDLVWLVPIGTRISFTSPFEIPPEAGTRSGHTNAGAVEAAKLRVIVAIANLKQSSLSTDLKDPVESSLSLLRSHQAAQRRVLLIGSDFIQDAGGRVASVDPRIEASAASVEVNMYVAQPQARYLDQMHITRYALVETVRTKSRGAFNCLGARSAAATPLDAIPVAHAVSAPAKRPAE
jgi:hypothetical protein